MQMSNQFKITLDSIDNGALNEAFQENLKKILENIEDPNTPAAAKRKITINLTFAPNDDREDIGLIYDVKPSLSPIKGGQTRLFVTKDSVTEFNKHAMKGQMSTEDLEMPENVVNVDTKFKAR